MKRLNVRVPREVQGQIFGLVRYIAKDSVDNALAWEGRLRATLMALGDFHGHAVDDDATARAGQQLRRAAFEGTYLIHYHVDERGAQVVIAGIRHAARLPREGEP